MSRPGFAVCRGGIYPSRVLCDCRKLAGTHICVPYKPSGNLRRGGIYAARAVYGGENIHGGVKTPPGSRWPPPGPYESLPCQREVARRAGGIPTGLAGLPITPANGQESLRLAALGTSL